MLPPDNERKGQEQHQEMLSQRPEDPMALLQAIREALQDRIAPLFATDNPELLQTFNRTAIKEAYSTARSLEEVALLDNRLGQAVFATAGERVVDDNVYFSLIADPFLADPDQYVLRSYQDEDAIQESGGTYNDFNFAPDSPPQKQDELTQRPQRENLLLLPSFYGMDAIPGAGGEGDIQEIIFFLQNITSEEAVKALLQDTLNHMNRGAAVHPKVNIMLGIPDDRSARGFMNNILSALLQDESAHGISAVNGVFPSIDYFSLPVTQEAIDRKVQEVATEARRQKIQELTQTRAIPAEEKQTPVATVSVAEEVVEKKEEEEQESTSVKSPVILHVSERRERGRHHQRRTNVNPQALETQRQDALTKEEKEAKQETRYLLHPAELEQLVEQYADLFPNALPSEQRNFLKLLMHAKGIVRVSNVIGKLTYYSPHAAGIPDEHIASFVGLDNHFMTAWMREHSKQLRHAVTDVVELPFGPAIQTWALFIDNKEGKLLSRVQSEEEKENSAFILQVLSGLSQEQLTQVIGAVNTLLAQPYNSELTNHTKKLVLGINGYKRMSPQRTQPDTYTPSYELSTSTQQAHARSEINSSFVAECMQLLQGMNPFYLDDFSLEEEQRMPRDLDIQNQARQAELQLFREGLTAENADTTLQAIRSFLQAEALYDERIVHAATATIVQTMKKHLENPEKGTILIAPCLNQYSSGLASSIEKQLQEEGLLDKVAVVQTGKYAPEFINFRYFGSYLFENRFNPSTIRNFVGQLPQETQAKIDGKDLSLVTELLENPERFAAFLASGSDTLTSGETATVDTYVAALTRVIWNQDSLLNMLGSNLILETFTEEAAIIDSIARTMKTEDYAELRYYVELMGSYFNPKSYRLLFQPTGTAFPNEGAGDNPLVRMKKAFRVYKKDIERRKLSPLDKEYKSEKTVIDAQDKATRVLLRYPGTFKVKKKK